MRRPPRTHDYVLLAALFTVGLSRSASATEPEKKPEAEPEEDRAKKLAQESQNPVSSLIQFPFQLNMAGGIGSFERSGVILNIQPVIPIPLSKKWTLVPRLITPLVGSPDITMAQGTTWGLGDFNPQIYIAVQLPAGFTVALGPTIVIPTATDSRLGSGKLSLGPSAVALWVGHGIVAGALVNNAWSIAGNAMSSDVNSFFLQPFFNLNLPKHTYLVTAPEITANWVKDTWVVPVGAGAGAILKLGLPANVSLQGYWNAHAPTDGPSWLVKFTVSFMFPIAKDAAAAGNALDKHREQQ
jgi:hypothetical protein